MATRTIYLSVDEPGHLHLRDSEGHSGEDDITTDATDGDTITWTLDENSGIAKITGIAAKPGSENLFSEGPLKVSDTEWQGTISSHASGEELYFIKYELIDGTKMKDDPRIVIRPPKK